MQIIAFYVVVTIAIDHIRYTCQHETLSEQSICAYLPILIRIHISFTRKQIYITW
jgi:hypothetical protein